MKCGGVTSGIFLIRRHGLRGVHTRKGVAEGQSSILSCGAEEGDPVHICTRMVVMDVCPLLLKSTEKLTLGGGYAMLPSHIGFYLHKVKHSLFAYVGQRTGDGV